MKQIIAVDADDTLFDENTAIRLFMNQTYGFQHSPEDYQTVGPHMRYWEGIWNLSPDETAAGYEAFVISAQKKDMQPLPHALEVLHELKQTYELVIITARDHRSVDMTHHSLTEHYPDIFKDVHFVPLWGDGVNVTKARICNEIGASYLIDD